MKFGYFVPNFGIFGNTHNCLRFAEEFELHGWDGFFLWDHILHLNKPRYVIDPWIVFAAIAVKTTKIKFGTMITPLSRRRPVKVARESATLDQISNGRFILGVGLSAPIKTDFEIFNEVTNDKIRAEMLDESLEILNGLWSGSPFSYSGKHYKISTPVSFLPSPINGKVPIWVGGYWPNKRPFRRAARFDGVIPGGTKIIKEPREKSYKQIKAYIDQNRINPSEAFDFVHYGRLIKNKDKLKKKFKELEYLGVTWWLIPEESKNSTFDDLLHEVAIGPPT